jgi:hypothetical protein
MEQKNREAYFPDNLYTSNNRALVQFLHCIRMLHNVIVRWSDSCGCSTLLHVTNLTSSKSMAKLLLVVAQWHPIVAQLRFVGLALQGCRRGVRHRSLLGSDPHDVLDMWSKHRTAIYRYLST